MNYIKKSAIILILSMSTSIVSYAANEAMKNSMDQGKVSKQGCMGNMNPDMMDKMMRSKQEHMLKMHDLANQILTEKNPTKKQKLKDEQLELMKNMHMKKMQKKMEMKSNGKMMDMKQKRKSQMGNSQ